MDAEKLGLGNEARALAKHPDKQFRQALAAMISRYQTPTALDVVQLLLVDSEREVQADAASALSTWGITPGAEPVCALLSKQLARSDEVAGVALWAGSSSRCVGMDGQVIAELGKRTADPAEITNAFGVKYALAASGVCSRTASADLKKKAFAVGQKLSDAKVPDANTRRSAIDVVVKCDPASAAKVLTALAKDNDKFVAEGAKMALDTPEGRAQRRQSRAHRERSGPCSARRLSTPRSTPRSRLRPAKRPR